MISIFILCFAALICVAVGLIFVWLVVKYRDEEFAFFFLIGIVLCVILTAASISEAVKRGDAYDQLDIKK